MALLEEMLALLRILQNTYHSQYAAFFDVKESNISSHHSTLQDSKAYEIGSSDKIGRNQF
jgi:hypothetical protein